MTISVKRYTLQLQAEAVAKLFFEKIMGIWSSKYEAPDIITSNSPTLYEVYDYSIEKSHTKFSRTTGPGQIWDRMRDPDQILV